MIIPRKSPADYPSKPKRMAATKNRLILENYFQTPSWNELWNKMKKDNPFIFIVVNKSSGEVERVLIKEVRPGMAFTVDNNLRDVVVVEKEPPRQTDEEILKEIGALTTEIEGLEELPPDLEAPIPTPEVRTEEVDIQPGDKIVIRNEGMTGTVEVLEVYEDTMQMKVRFPSSKKEVIKDAADFVRMEK